MKIKIMKGGSVVMSESRYSIIQDMTNEKNGKIELITTLKTEIENTKQCCEDTERINNAKIRALESMVKSLDEGIKAIQDVSKEASNP